LPRVIFVFVFVASGIAALIYQTIWQRMLTLFGGADVFSVTIVVAAFMGGLGFGHLAGGHLADKLDGRRRLMAFAACEIAVAAFALASSWIYYDWLYVRLGALNWSPAALAALIFLVTLWPTFWMGVSLPLASKVVTTDAHEPARWVPVLYGANTLGAAAGSALSIAFLFPRFSFPTSLAIGASVSVTCALAALALLPALSSMSGANRPNAPSGSGFTAAFAGNDRTLPWIAWLAIYALSGFVALSLEIVWFRMLGVALKSNAYTFGHLLTIFLAGVGLGSLAANSRTARRWPPVRSFLLLQAAIPISAALIVTFLVRIVNRVDVLNPVWQYYAQYEPLVRLNLASPLYVIVHLIVPVALILPPTMMMGLSFGCLQRAVQRDIEGLGRRVGWLQTANIVGSMLGALVTGLGLLQWLGSPGTVRLLILLSAPFVVLLVMTRGRSSVIRPASVAVLAAVTFAAVPDGQTFWAKLHGAEPDVVTQAEDRSGIALMKPRRNDTQVVIHANGVGMGWLPYGGAHTALGALPSFIHPEPRHVVLIGLGAGETVFGAAGRSSLVSIDSIEIVQPELLVLERFPDRARFPTIGRLLADKRIRHHFTDGRAFLRRSAERYDIIEADALRPTSAYSGNLYSVEYFMLVRDRLAPGGLAVTWAPTRRVVDSLVSVFPYVLVFGDVAVGSQLPIAVDRAAILARMDEPFSREHYAAGGVSISAILSKYISVEPVRFTPESPRPAERDLNRDLFPRDEFGGGTEPFSTD
jgi:MFS family permease